MESLKLVWHFFIHILTGTGVFVGIGFAFVLLHWFVQWVETQGIPIQAIYVLRFVEYLVFSLDVLSYLWFLGRVTWKFAREIKDGTA